ncbi:MAG: aspartate carbamoyltransferase regulatory subunit [Candidatus Aenigmatarchaeota archaeon]|nr:MAG: aspartate carbamoyltransferase regulatory subunit [Candidatus Aenigmarchaeota archaeon]
MGEDLKVRMIENGTVIDHLPAGSAMHIAGLLNLSSNLPVIIAMNVESAREGKKDMVKIENKFLSRQETDKISFVAPNATINIIKNRKVKDKRRVNPPDELNDILECPNKKCITNMEDCGTKFLKKGQKYKCYFCESQFRIEEFNL